MKKLFSDTMNKQKPLDGTVKRLLKLPSPALAAALVSVAIMFYALIILPVGMADNGDFYRVANGQGIYKLDRNESDQYLSYFSKTFGAYQYFNEFSGGSIFTTQVPFIQTAKAIDSLFTGADAFFDIRFLSAVFMLYCAVAIYLIVDYATYHVQGVASYGIAALCVFMFADTGYTAYFNSFFAEGLVYVTFLCTVACALLLTQQRYSPYGLLIMLVLNGLLLIGAKQQNAPLGVLLGLLCVSLVIINKVQNKRKSEDFKTYYRNPLLFRRLTVGASVILCACGVASYALIPQEFVNINQYHAMTRGVLMTSENPEKTLTEFGIDRQYAMLNNSIYYEKYPAVDVENPILTDNFYSRYSFFTISAYYISHPQKLLQMLDVSARLAYNIRPESIGNLEKSAGAKPGAQTSYFTFHSTLKAVVAPKTIGFIVIWFILAVALTFRDKGKCTIVFFSILMGLSQIGVSIIGAGDADLAKHMFLYNVVFDLINFLGGAVLIVYLCRWVTKFIGNFKAKRDVRRIKVTQNV